LLLLLEGLNLLNGRLRSCHSKALIAPLESLDPTT